MATPLPLEGDGLVENLFYFLWSKDDFGGGPRVYIPHTVVFKLSQPALWYFTSLRTNKIKKKSRANLTNAQIEHEFTKKKSPTDIVAYYMYQPSNDHDSASPTFPSSPVSYDSKTTIEYFDVSALREFLYKRDKPHGGILQKFILPKCANNATIRAIWSPKICLLERAVNRRNVYDKRFGVYERGVTFDGPADTYSSPEPVRGAALPGEIQALCEAVVDHVTRVSYHKYRISRMVLHLKSDADDRLWLLWCSSLRLLNPDSKFGLLQSSSAPAMSNIARPLDIVGEAQVPEFAPFGRQVHQGNSFAAGWNAGVHGRQRAGALAISSHSSGEHGEHRLMFGQARCVSCALLVDRRKLLATTYKAVIEHFTRFLKFFNAVPAEGENAKTQWPPNDKYIQAAGGVGFGILSHLSADGTGSPHLRRGFESTSLPAHIRSTIRPELVIPPVIRYLHPSFAVDDFERHRRDPIFLHKQAPVCDACCLVYADYSTSALEANSIRQTAPAILRPHSEITGLRLRLDPLDPVAIALASSPTRTVSSNSPTGARIKDKPPASAWKPLSTAASNTSLSPTKKTLRPVNKGKKSMLRFPSAPELPERIDSFEELRDAECDELSRSTNNHDHVYEREERFFRELYSQKTLEKGHPLLHMVESATRLGKNHQRLDALGGGGYSSKLMGNVASTGSLANAVIDAERNSNLRQFKSPYSVPQRLHDPPQINELIEEKPANTGKTQENKSTKHKGRKQQRKQNLVQAAEAKAMSGPERFVSSREKGAADAHRDFLIAALSEAKGQLETMESLTAVVSVEEESESETESEPSEPSQVHNVVVANSDIQKIDYSEPARGNEESEIEHSECEENKGEHEWHNQDESHMTNEEATHQDITLHEANASEVDVNRTEAIVDDDNVIEEKDELEDIAIYAPSPINVMRENVSIILTELNDTINADTDRLHDWRLASATPLPASDGHSSSLSSSLSPVGSEFLDPDGDGTEGYESEEDKTKL